MQVLARDGIHLIVVDITLVKFVHVGENLLEAGIFDVLRGVTVEDMEDDRQMIDIIIAVMISVSRSCPWDMIGSPIDPSVSLHDAKLRTVRAIMK